MLTYGVYLGFLLLDGTLQQALAPQGAHWSDGQPWSAYVHYFSRAIADEIRLGAIFLLAMMTAPLAFGFFSYHVYLVWAGMTTNETAKWDDWKEDIADGFIFKARQSEIYRNPRPPDEFIAESRWPGTSDQILILTDGEPPRVGFAISTQSNSILQSEDQDAPIDPRWERVQSLRAVDNIYDLGFWRNLRDALRFPVR
jgi:palmitoyltransferase